MMASVVAEDGFAVSFSVIFFVLLCKVVFVSNSVLAGNGWPVGSVL